MKGTTFITGASSGLGLALAERSLYEGYRVVALQRRSSALRVHPEYSEVLVDLAGPESAVNDAVCAALSGTQRLDRVILNAGALGSIQDLGESPLAALRDLMDINLWANKTVLDALFAQDIPVQQVIGISSGAAVSGSRGWGGYALSKAAFVMLLRLYAAERPQTHFASLAPGLVDTAMQDYLCGLPPQVAEQFPSVKRIQSARGTDTMPTASQVAEQLLPALDALLGEPSGAYVDIRTWKHRHAEEA